MKALYTFAAKNRPADGWADGFDRSSIPPSKEPQALAWEGLHSL